MTLVIAVALLGWWAGRATLAPTAATPTQIATPVTATVVEGTVGQTVRYNLTVRQKPTQVATNLLSGVVTTVGPEMVDVGDVLYTVAGVPAVAVRGSLPFYRDLSNGMTGPDVAQLQQMLADLGYPQPVTGHWASITTRNVAAWHKDLCEGTASKGITPTCEAAESVAPLGTLVALPSLPTRVNLGDMLRPGALVSGGEPGVSIYTGTPDFVLVLTPDQARAISEGTAVTVDAGAQTWEGFAGTTRTGETGSVEIPVTSRNGGPLCGDDCNTLPAEEVSLLPARVQLVPEVSGPSVPVAAVRTDESGASYVLLPDGSHAPVQVLGAGNGLAVVDGLDLGTRIVILE